MVGYSSCEQVKLAVHGPVILVCQHTEVCICACVLWKHTLSGMAAYEVILALLIELLWHACDR